MAKASAADLEGWLAPVARFELGLCDSAEVTSESLLLVPRFDSAALAALADVDYSRPSTRLEVSAAIGEVYREFNLTEPSSEDYRWIVAWLAFRAEQSPAEREVSWRDLSLVLDWNGELSHLIGPAAEYLDEVDQMGSGGADQYLLRVIESERDSFYTAHATYWAERAQATWIGKLLNRSSTCRGT